jgi:hypothetical protein
MKTGKHMTRGLKKENENGLMSYSTVIEGQQMVFINGSIPSSKNSKVATSKGVFHSKTVGKFLREMGIQHYSVSRKEVTYYKTRQCLFPVEELSQLLSISHGIKPVKIGIHFVRQTKAKFDFHNICQIVFDLLVAFDIIEDDNMDCILPLPMQIDNKWYSVDKLNPGCFISILK